MNDSTQQDEEGKATSSLIVQGDTGGLRDLLCHPVDEINLKQGAALTSLFIGDIVLNRKFGRYSTSR